MKSLVNILIIAVCACGTLCSAPKTISYYDASKIFGGDLTYNSCGNASYGGGYASCPNYKSPSPCIDGVYEICNDGRVAYWCGTSNPCDKCSNNIYFKCRSYRGKWVSILGNCYQQGTQVETTANCRANDGYYHGSTCK